MLTVAEYKSALRARKLAAGQCGRCSRPATPGRSTCEPCAEQHRVRMARYLDARDKRADEERRQRNRDRMRAVRAAQRETE